MPEVATRTPTSAGAQEAEHALPHSSGANDLSSDRAQSWWAVQIRHGREFSAADDLRSRGYETFLPCYPEHRRWSDRVRKVERALFPGYVFCRLTVSVMGRVVSARGVIRIVGNCRGPLPIPSVQIDAVRRIVEARVAVSPWPFVRVGQTVLVTGGPLRALEGVVLATKSGRRLVLSISLLQQSVAVEMDADWIAVPVQRTGALSGCAAHERKWRFNAG